MKLESLKNEMMVRTLRIEHKNFDEFLLKISSDYDEKIKNLGKVLNKTEVLKMEFRKVI